MDSMDDRALARLIAERQGLSVLDKEAVFDHVLAQVERRPARASGIGRWVAAVVTLSAALVAIGLHLQSGGPALPAATQLPIDQASRDALAPRGAGDAGPSFALRCLRAGADAPCSIGSTLAFEMQSVRPGLHFAAWATDAQGHRIWYLPSAEGQSVAVDPRQRLLRAAISVGSEHVASRYEVVGLFSDRALARDRLEAVARGAAPPAGAVIVRRELRLEGLP